MSEISIWYLKHSKYHIVNQKMTTFEMFMKNEATCERLLRFCISGLAEILMKNTKYSNCQIARFFLEQSQCIENILNINCTCTRTTSLKFEIFLTTIAGGQAELGKEEEARVDGEHYYIISYHMYFIFQL